MPSIVSIAYGAYLDHADAENLAKPPFMRICREFENWRFIRKVFATKILLSGKFSLFATLSEAYLTDRVQDAKGK